MQRMREGSVQYHECVHDHCSQTHFTPKSIRPLVPIKTCSAAVAFKTTAAAVK